MDIINQAENNQPKCCSDHCTNSFENNEQEIINSYKCHGRKLSSADIWNIQKNKRGINRRINN